jgi:KDO2-lipid IV(A) lauroyltransferase
MIIFHYIFSAIAWFLSILPFRIIYILSDFLYFITYYVYGYRKKIVFNNLKNSFPKKNDKEIKIIAKKFYHNLCDIILETIKAKNISKKELKKRVRFKNIEILEDLYKSKRNVMAIAGHCGNWEWLSILPALTDYTVIVAEKPVTDKFFENYINNIRTRFNLKLAYFKKIFKFLVKNKNEHILAILGSDQTPTKSEIEYRTNFLNQETPMFIGAEKIAKYLDYSVVFFDMQRTKRGFYEVEIIKITDRPQRTDEFEITEKHIHLLEKSITEHPDNWLWSHRRWKHKKMSGNT